MPPRPNHQPRRNSSGNDRFGYRPSPEVRQIPPQFTHQIGYDRKQLLIDRIQFDRLQRQWRKENATMRRERWEDFGNKNLPIDHYKHDIMKMVATNRISLLAGETGSGKSTQLAQYALEMGYDHIVYLQPRRVTTDNISERLDEELTEQFAEKRLHKPPHLVGMAHSEHATLREDSVIQVMTSAVFKKRAPELREEWANKKVLIVADEVHEGNIETEFAVATAAELMTEKPSWNMVLMSATLNEEEVQQAYAPINGRPIPKITVEGRPFDIQYNERPDMNVVDIFETECAESNKTLIFTDGKRSIGAITKELLKRDPDLRILPLHSKISDEQRREIFGADPEGTRTVIVSTSAGQSGLTIPGVDRVISDGWTKSPELDDENAAGLPRRYCTKAELTQQMGRGGRDIDGAKFFLARPLSLRHRPGSSSANERFVRYHEREEHIPADIYHTVITRNVLSAAAMDRDFYTLNEYLIHKVTRSTIQEAYTVLRLLGAVDEQNLVTDLGREMDKYPLRPELARAVAGIVLGGGDTLQKQQIAVIAASIEAGGLGSYDPEKLKQLQSKISAGTSDDFLAELDYFMSSIEFIKTEQGTLSPYLDGEHADTMPRIEHDSIEDEVAINAGFDVRNVLRAHKQYRKICHRMGIPREQMYDNLTNDLTPQQREMLHQALLTGMPHLLYAEVGRSKWRGRRRNQPDGTKQSRPPIVWYRNVLGPEKGEPYEYDRRVSTRSLLGNLALDKSALIAGYPRWYLDSEDEVHNVIERGFATTRQKVRAALGRTAFAVRDQVTVGQDGRLQRIEAGSIGTIRTYKSVKKSRADSEQSVEMLVRVSLDKPGPAQRELRQLKRQLESIAERIPISQRNYFFEKAPLSDHDMKALIQSAAHNVASLGELDANLREVMRVSDINLYAFITSENIQAVEENMPATLEIGGWPYDVFYEGGEARPYITGFSLEHALGLPDHLMIRDGREVFFRYHFDGIVDLTAQDVKEMAKIR